MPGAQDRLAPARWNAHGPVGTCPTIRLAIGRWTRAHRRRRQGLRAARTSGTAGRLGGLRRHQTTDRRSRRTERPTGTGPPEVQSAAPRNGAAPRPQPAFRDLPKLALDRPRRTTEVARPLGRRLALATTHPAGSLRLHRPPLRAVGARARHPAAAAEALAGEGQAVTVASRRRLRARWWTAVPGRCRRDRSGPRTRLPGPMTLVAPEGTTGHRRAGSSKLENEVRSAPKTAFPGR